MHPYNILVPDVPPPSPARCSFPGCQFSAASAKVLLLHETRHSQSYQQCPTCHTLLKTVATLRRHKVTQHAVDALYTCGTCGKAHRDPAGLSRCEERHRGQYRCPVEGCTKTNFRKDSIQRHVSKKHPTVAVPKIPFDNTLGTPHPPATGRAHAQNAFHPHATDTTASPLRTSPRRPDISLEVEPNQTTPGFERSRRWEQSSAAVSHQNNLPTRPRQDLNHEGMGAASRPGSGATFLRSSISPTHLGTFPSCLEGPAQAHSGSANGELPSQLLIFPSSPFSKPAEGSSASSLSAVPVLFSPSASRATAVFPPGRSPWPTLDSLEWTQIEPLAPLLVNRKVYPDNVVLEGWVDGVVLPMSVPTSASNPWPTDYRE